MKGRCAALRSWWVIGIGAVLLGRSVVGEGAIVAAGCVVPEGFRVPPWSLVVGVPAKIVKTFDAAFRTKDALERAADYAAKARAHAAGRWSR